MGYFFYWLGEFSPLGCLHKALFCTQTETLIGCSFFQQENSLKGTPAFSLRTNSVQQPYPLVSLAPSRLANGTSNKLFEMQNFAPKLHKFCVACRKLEIVLRSERAKENTGLASVLTLNRIASPWPHHMRRCPLTTFAPFPPNLIAPPLPIGLHILWPELSHGSPPLACPAGSRLLVEVPLKTAIECSLFRVEWER